MDFILFCLRAFCKPPILRISEKKSCHWKSLPWCPAFHSPSSLSFSWIALSWFLVLSATALDRLNPPRPHHAQLGKEQSCAHPAWPNPPAECFLWLSSYWKNERNLRADGYVYVVFIILHSLLYFIKFFYL